MIAVVIVFPLEMEYVQVRSMLQFVSSTEISKMIRTFMEWMYRCCESCRHTWILFATNCTPLLFRIPVQGGLFASAGDKGIACAKRIEISLSLYLHLPCVFSAFPFHPRRANRSNRRALSVCRSVYRIRMYKERKNGELVRGINA